MVLNTPRRSSIVPVWIRGKSGRKMITYAMLDSQSDSIFLSDNLASSLDVMGKNASREWIYYGGNQKCWLLDNQSEPNSSIYYLQLCHLQKDEMTSES